MKDEIEHWVLPIDHEHGHPRVAFGCPACNRGLVAPLADAGAERHCEFCGAAYVTPGYNAHMVGAWESRALPPDPAARTVRSQIARAAGGTALVLFIMFSCTSLILLDPPDSPEVARHKRAVVERARADARDRARYAQAKAERPRWHELEDGTEIGDAVTIKDVLIKNIQSNGRAYKYRCLIDVENIGGALMPWTARIFFDDADGRRIWSGDGDMIMVGAGREKIGFDTIVKIEVVRGVLAQWRESDNGHLGVEIRKM